MGPYKPGFATVTGRGDNPLYTNQMEVHVDGSELLGKKPVEILYLKPHAENVILVEFSPFSQLVPGHSECSRERLVASVLKCCGH